MFNYVDIFVIMLICSLDKLFENLATLDQKAENVPITI